MVYINICKFLSAVAHKILKIKCGLIDLYSNKRLFFFQNLLLVIIKVFAIFFHCIFFYKNSKTTEQFIKQIFYQKCQKRIKIDYYTFLCNDIKTITMLINYNDSGIDPLCLLKITLNFNMMLKINLDLIVNVCSTLSTNSYQTKCITYTIISCL